MIIRNQLGHVIRSVEDWFAHAPPRGGAGQWKDYRSAKALANAYFRPRVPEEIATLFRTHADFADFVVDEAIAEYRIALDEFGGDRNADLVLLGRTAAGSALVTVEAKADEEFARLTGDYVDQMAAEPTSNLPARANQLSSALFGRPLDPAIRQLRYQLLHGAAATLIEAKTRGARHAAFVVHEFRSAQTSEVNLAANAKDWAYFLSLLGVTEPRHGCLSGPIGVTGGGRVPKDIPLYFGKVAVHLP